MVILRKRHYFALKIPIWSKIITGILLIILSFNICAQASANGGPVRIIQLPTSTIWPVVQTNVTVEEENLVLNFIQKSNYKTGVNVSAEYKLYNQSNESEFVWVGFPISADSDNLTIVFDNEPINYEVMPLLNLEILDNKEILNFKTDFLKENIWLDPIRREKYLSSTPEIDLRGMKIALFKISLKEKDSKILKVEYNDKTSIDNKQTILMFYRSYYHYTYHLKPASFWSSFKNLKVTVYIPKDWELMSEPALQETSIDGNQRIYTMFFSTIPSNALNLSMVDLHKKFIISPLLYIFFVFSPFFAILLCLLIRIIRNIFLTHNHY